MSHAPWHSGGTYTGAHKDFDVNKGYTGSGSQSGNNDDYTGQAIIDDIDQAQATNDIQNLIDNKNKYQYLYLDPNDPRNEYQKMMHALKTGGTYTSPGGIIPNNLMGLPYDELGRLVINQGQQIGEMSVAGNPQGAEAYKKKFPNPLIKLAQGLGDVYETFSPTAQIMKGFKKAKTGIQNLFTGDDNQLDKTSSYSSTSPIVHPNMNDVAGLPQAPTVEEVSTNFALNGPGANFQENLLEEVQTLKQGGIVHAADGVFAESETMKMPLTLPEIKQARKKMEEGFQYDIEIDGRNKSFSFDEQLGPSGIETLRERESITPFDTGLDMYGAGKFAEGNTPEARRALEILKSIDPNQPGHFHMQGGTALDYKANGGYMSSFPNQNLNTESLSASDNIDDRIMKNLQFEKMAPGMMGYNTGGMVEPMEPDYSTGF